MDFVRPFFHLIQFEAHREFMKIFDLLDLSKKKSLASFDKAITDLLSEHVTWPRDLLVDIEDFNVLLKGLGGNTGTLRTIVEKLEEAYALILENPNKFPNCKNGYQHNNTIKTITTQTIKSLLRKIAEENDVGLRKIIVDEMKSVIKALGDVYLLNTEEQTRLNNAIDNVNNGVISPNMDLVYRQPNFSR